MLVLSNLVHAIKQNSRGAGQKFGNLNWVLRTPILYCLEHKRSNSARRRKEPAREKVKYPKKAPLLCRTCRIHISDAAALFSLDSERCVRVFPDPMGELREIFTLLSAENVQLDGAATTAFTWFSGYAWEIAYCKQCAQHLGWRYTAVHLHNEPETFYGLLRKALVWGASH